MNGNNIIDFFEKLYYGRKASDKISTFNIFRAIEVLKKYDILKTSLQVHENVSSGEEQEKYLIPDNDILYAMKDKNETVFDIYFLNMHFHVEDTENGRLVRVYLKMNGSNWILVRKGSNYDFSNPENTSIEIYRWFNISIHGEDDIERERYMDGTWNKEVFEETILLKDKIDRITDYRRVSDSYKKKAPDNEAGKL